MCLTRGQNDVRPHVQMRQTPTIFSRVSTGDSDMPSSCEMSDEPEFKPPQVNRAFFSVRASRGPFHLRQKTQGPSQMPTVEGKLLFRCLWKLVHLFSQRQGISSHLGKMKLFSSCCNEINIHIDLRLLSQGISVVSERKSSHLFCMMGNTR